MQAAFLVGLGGMIGTLARYWMTLLAAKWVGEAFPWGTLVINVGGSFIIGVAAAITGATGPYAGNTSLRLLIMVGICGGFTTFSSFSLQTLTLLRSGQWPWAVAYAVASVLLCLGATAMGMALFTRA
jgi:CrcB protein